MQTLHIQLENRSYPIYIGEGLLSQIKLIESHLKQKHVAVVTNTKVAPLYLDPLLTLLKEHGIKAFPIILPDGESYKNQETLNLIYDALLKEKCGRTVTLIALGGGVIGDMTGYAAATYLRGVPFIQMPTTLLSQVDSSVGGKTGINHPKGKNLIGAFHQPAGVAIDIDVLRSLPDREYRSGLAEIVKYGMIMDAELFAFLESNAVGILARKPELLMHIIRRSCECKAEVVSQDEREETGLRAILNFGHTFAHAFETIGGYGSWLHGEAVAAGMVCANKVSLKRGLIDADTANRMVALLKAFKLPTEPPELSSAALLEVMRNDKKSVRGSLRFILATKLGAVALFDDVTEENVKGVLSPLN